MPALPRDFAARVRAARAYTHLDRPDFGALLGVSGSTVGNYENGKSKPDKRAIAETMQRLAKASKLPEWFFTTPRLSTLLLGANGDATGTAQRD